MSSLPPSERPPIPSSPPTSVGAPLMGRETDLARLMDALQESRTRVTQRVIAGPQGIGKSRLVREFILRARTAVPGLRIYRGSAREGDTNFAVVARALRARFGVVEGMDAEAQKAQVRAQVSAVHRDRKVGDVCFFMGRFLGLEFQESPVTHAVRYEEVGAFAMQRAVLRHFWDEDARREAEGKGPLVLIYEDLHFADDDTLALLEGLGARGDAPVLHVLIGRGEFLARAATYRRAEMKSSLLELRPLGDTEAKSVVGQLLAPCGDVV
jgi:predicted ATPase